jgi:hypothetical protein
MSRFLDDDYTVSALTVLDMGDGTLWIENDEPGWPSDEQTAAAAAIVLMEASLTLTFIGGDNTARLYAWGIA